MRSRSACRTHALGSYSRCAAEWLNAVMFCQCSQNLTPWHMLSSPPLKQRFSWGAIAAPARQKKSVNPVARLCKDSDTEWKEWRGAEEMAVLIAFYVFFFLNCSPSPFLETIDKCKANSFPSETGTICGGGRKSDKNSQISIIRKRLQNWICVVQVLRAEDRDYTVRST